MKQEKKLNNSPEPVTISGTKTILNQLMNCICKLNINGVNGTGFFCKIPFQNNETKIFLMTNYHVLDKNYYEANNKINLLINDEKEIKTIDLRIKRNTYFNQDNDITLIEINENDNIKNYLELDENLFRHNNNILYEHKSLYVLQYPQGRNASVSYGILTSLDKYEIKHICSTENGSSGSPILNLKSNKVIGIHKEGSINFEFNKGTYLKYILIDFIQKNTNKINENQYSIINNNNVNIQNNYENYNKMYINNFNIEENNYFNQLNNIKFETDIYDDRNKPGQIKINVNFKNNYGQITNLIFNPNRTVDEMLTAYLKKIKRPELIGKKHNPRFIYNLKDLLFGDKTLLSNLTSSWSIEIFVSWPNTAIGGP